MKIELYKSSDAITQAMNHIFDTEQEREDTIEAVKGQFVADAESTIASLLNHELMTDAMEKRIKEMQELVKKNRAKEDKARHAISECMKQHGITKLEASDGSFKVSFRKSTAIEIFDEDQIPEEMMTKKVTLTPNKTEIKNAIEFGMDVPGAKIVTREHLQIK